MTIIVTKIITITTICDNVSNHETNKLSFMRLVMEIFFSILSFHLGNFCTNKHDKGRK